MMFSGLDTHPGCRKYKFRVKAPVLKAAPPVHRVRPYLQLGDLHGLDIWNPSMFTAKKADAGEGAPFWSLRFPHWGLPVNGGRSNGRSWCAPCRTGRCWSPWRKTARGFRPGGTAAGGDEGRGSRKIWFPVMDAAAGGIAVDGVIPSLCSCRGLPTVTLFSTRLPDVCRPLGQFHRSLYSHRCCSPCFLRECDRGTPCNRSISVQEVLNALAEISGKS